MHPVFLSYRQLNDSERKRVRAFAQQLRDAGVEVILDQFFLDANPGGPDEGWDKWSSDCALKTERVLIVGSEAWFACFEKTQLPGTGLGAACEADDIRYRIYESGGIVSSIRIVLLDLAASKSVPPKLNRYHRFHAEKDIPQIVRWLGSPAASSDPLPLPNAGERRLPRLGKFKTWMLSGVVGIGATAMMAWLQTKPPPKEHSASNQSLGTTNSLGMEFVALPSEATTDGQSPPSLLFSRWETRIQDYRLFAAENPQAAGGEWKCADGHVPKPEEGWELHPVVNIACPQAEAFCRWLTLREASRTNAPWIYRLPTDNEWSRAAGLSKQEQEMPPSALKEHYPWGGIFPPAVQEGNYCRMEAKVSGLTMLMLDDDHYKYTAPVNAPEFKLRSGLAHLGGNVWEICKQGSGGWVLRGASYNDQSREMLRTTARMEANPGVETGFRVIAEVKP